MNKQETEKIDKLLKFLFEKGYDPEDKKKFNQLSAEKCEKKKEEKFFGILSRLD